MTKADPERPDRDPVTSMTDLLSASLTRRDALRVSGGTGAMFMLSGVLAACGSSSSSSAPSLVNLGPLKITPGTEIPKATVRYGLLPYGDNSMPVIGMGKGWFNDVGITIQPQPDGSKVQDAQVVPKLVNNEVDLINWDGTVIVQTMTKAPNIKMAGFTDTYLGIYILAAPGTANKSVSNLVVGGMSFQQAMKKVMGQLVGKHVALDNTGYHRSFFNTIFQLGGIQPSQMKLTTIDDAKMVQLGKAGQIDFASPAGAAQVVELLKIGWLPIIGVEDLLKGLPPGDPRAVGTLDNVGPALSQQFYEKNRETVLRVMSVNFRIVDAILNEPDKILPVQLPYLESVTGGNYGLPDVKLIYSKIDPLTPFEHQSRYWTDTSNPQYYRNIYNPQIKSLQAGGVLPKGQTLDASQVFLAPEIYRTMLALKDQYEKLAPKAQSAKPQLAAKAKTQADNRNYLDAVRFALAATKA